MLHSGILNRRLFLIGSSATRVAEMICSFLASFRFYGLQFFVGHSKVSCDCLACTLSYFHSFVMSPMNCDFKLSTIKSARYTMWGHSFARFTQMRYKSTMSLARLCHTPSCLLFLSVLASVISGDIRTMGRRGKNKAATASTKSKGPKLSKAISRAFVLNTWKASSLRISSAFLKGLLHLTGQFPRLGTGRDSIGDTPILHKEESDEDAFRNASVLPDMDGESSAEEEQEKAQVMVKTNKVHSIVAG